MSGADLPLGAPDPTSVSQLRALFAAHDFHPRRNLGQTFLTDANIVRKIVARAEVGPTDSVLEIGPGAGAMTRELVRRARRVVAVEVDARLVTLLRETVGEAAEVVHQDVLEVEWEGLLQGEGAGAWQVVANLPYAITGPAVLKLLEAKSWLRQLTIMVQLEVAERLVAPPGSRTRGILGVLAQAACEARLAFRVSRTCFWPMPQVDSAVVSLVVRRPAAVPEALAPQFRLVVRAAFGARRKTLGNALSQSVELGLPRAVAQDLLAECGLEHDRRAESLSEEEFLRLTQSYVAWAEST